MSASAVFAGNSFQDKCSNIDLCAKVVSEMTGQKYLYDKDVKGELFSTSNIEITSENVVTLFTMMLSTNGFTRVPVPGTNNTFQILRLRDARDANVPSVQASATQALPENKTYDLVTMRYKLNHPSSAESIARTLRSFMPANSRIVPMESGYVYVTDQMQNLFKSYQMIKENDVNVTVQAKKKKE